MRVASALALGASVSSVAAVSQGFNYGATARTGAANVQSDFESMFSTAKKLAGTNGAYSSARLYTTIQAGTTNTPISAIPAAIAQNTSILLGMWASSGQANIANEIAALQSAISTYGSAFTSRVVGLSVGSEDLYRITPTGYANDPNSVGAGPDELVSYIKQVRSALSGTALSGVAIGHVDTWTAWVNGTNSAVAANCDWIGMNTFPYFQTTDANSIASGPALFNAALAATQGASGGKPVWITETGWPVAGKSSNLATASTTNAKSYYDAVGCNTLFGKTNTWWYTLVDANTDVTGQPQFGVVGTTLSSNTLFDLSCSAVSSSSSASSSTSTSASVSGSSSAPITTSASPTAPVSSGGALVPANSNAVSSPASSSVAGSVTTAASSRNATTPAATGTPSTAATGGASVGITTSSTRAATSTTSATPSGFTGAAAPVKVAGGALGAVVAAAFVLL